MIYVLKRRQAVTAVLVCVTLIACLVASGARRRTVATAATVNWGLHFAQNGQPPIGNADAKTLAQYRAYYVGDTTKKTLYITFDAGYENGYTPAILDALKKHNVSATFFVVGHYLESAPDLIRRMVEEGHTVGNHTYHHPDMSAIADKAAFERELKATEDAYEQIIGKPMPKVYRPPQGKYNENNLALARDLGYTTLLWSLAYVDWITDNQPTAQHAFDKLLPRTHNGAVVLLHSTSATNAAILDELLTKWEEMGYTFGSISDLCGE